MAITTTWSVSSMTHVDADGGIIIAIQEQQTLIETLQAEVAALKGE